jgi:hypothetical protein
MNPSRRTQWADRLYDLLDTLPRELIELIMDYIVWNFKDPVAWIGIPSGPHIRAHDESSFVQCDSCVYESTTNLHSKHQFLEVGKNSRLGTRKICYSATDSNIEGVNDEMYSITCVNVDHFQFTLLDMSTEKLLFQVVSNEPWSEFRWDMDVYDGILSLTTTTGSSKYTFIQVGLNSLKVTARISASFPKKTRIQRIRFDDQSGRVSCLTEHGYAFYEPASKTTHLRLNSTGLDSCFFQRDKFITAESDTVLRLVEYVDGFPGLTQTWKLPSGLKMCHFVVLSWSEHIAVATRTADIWILNPWKGTWISIPNPQNLVHLQSTGNGMVLGFGLSGPFWLIGRSQKPDDETTPCSRKRIKISS